MSLNSLPLLFSTMPETIPATFPYLDVNLLRRRRNVAAVTLPGAASGRKVGVIWSPQADADDNRHLACRFDTFKPLFSTPGACFFNLHAGTTSQTAASLSALNVESPGASISNPADLALLIDQLGLIVGVDSPTIHIAGALGKPAWVLHGDIPAWYWPAASDTTPWYPGMRVFRQPEPGDWAGVVERVAGTLAAFCTR